MFLFNLVLVNLGEPMKLLPVLITLLLLSGCAGVNFSSSERWIMDNTFYSTKLPAIQVIVSDEFQYSSTHKKGALTTDTTGQSKTGKDEEKYRFIGDNKRLTVNIQTINNNRWYMVPPDYSKDEKALMYDTEKLNGIPVNTGISVQYYESLALLSKAFGGVAGDSVRYHIYYGEFIGSEWFKKSKQTLTTSDRDFLIEFNERANNSFSLTKYDGTTPPSKQAGTKKIADKSVETEDASEVSSGFFLERIRSANLALGMIDEESRLVSCFGGNRRESIAVLEAEVQESIDEWRKEFLHL